MLLLESTLQSSDRERSRLEQLLNAGNDTPDTRDQTIQQLNSEIDNERQISQQALSKVELLNQQISALRRQIAALEDALDASESRDRESQTKIADLANG